jgi:hypothetical protein
MVEITYLAIAGIALVAMFFGYGFGLFEGRTQGYKKRQKEEAANKVETPAPEPVPVRVDDPGMLRIKSEGGYLSLDLDGARVDTAALTADERKRLIEMLSLMRPWLEGKPVPALERTGHAPQGQPPSTIQPQQSAPLTSPPAASRPVTSPPAAPRPATIAREDRPVAPAGSIVTQIDSVLQSRLAGTPLEDRGIFLAQSPEGGVMVYVGLTKYLGIEDVPDPEVKAAIRGAIAEWENKYTPGL